MEISSASKQRIDYMKLLVTQMQNQNPLEPVDNKDMAAQLAQFSQLEETEKMTSSLSAINTNFSQLLRSSQLEYASGLLGNRISFEKEGTTIVGEVVEANKTDDGVVLTTSVQYNDENGNPVQSYVEVNLDDVKSVIKGQM